MIVVDKYARRKTLAGAILLIYVETGLSHLPITIGESISLNVSVQENSYQLHVGLTSSVH